MRIIHHSTKMIQLYGKYCFDVNYGWYWNKLVNQLKTSNQSRQHQLSDTLIISVISRLAVSSTRSLYIPLAYREKAFILPHNYRKLHLPSFLREMIQDERGRSPRH